VARASTAAAAGRGRIGLAGELAGRLKRARKGKTGGGNLAHHVKKRRASSRAKRKRQRQGSTTAAAQAVLRQAGTQAPGAARLLWRLPLVNKHHVRVMIVHGEEKGKAAMHFTDGDVLHGGGRKQRRRRRWNWARTRALVCYSCKGKGRSLSASLNRARRRKARGDGRTPSGGACH
jgi:hypothetical protein